MSEDVNGNWEVWGVEHFVDEFMAGIKFGQPSAMLLNLQPLLDITKVICARSGMPLGLLNNGVQQSVMAVVSDANGQSDDSKRREVITAGIEAMFRKYGLSKEI